jgi:uncharacterized protein (DUF433 family)
MELPDFLSQQPDGDLILKGHRIGLWHVLRRYQEGYSPEMLVGQYPTLPLALVHKVIAFYLEQQSEIDAYLAGYQADLERQCHEHPARIDVARLFIP